MQPPEPVRGSPHALAVRVRARQGDDRLAAEVRFWSGPGMVLVAFLVVSLDLQSVGTSIEEREDSFIKQNSVVQL